MSLDHGTVTALILTEPRDAGKAFLAKRLEERWEQRDVAEAASTAQSVISGIESGGSGGLDLIMRIAASLGYRVALVPFEYKEAADA